MDYSKKKDLGFICLFILMIFIVSITINNLEFTKKNKESTPPKILETTKNESIYTIPDNTQKKIPDTSINNSEKIQFYYSSDNSYYLVLTSNYKHNTITNVSTLENRYIMSIDTYNYKKTFTGTYEIINNQLFLTVEAGCLDTNNKFNCPLPEEVTIQKYNKIVLEFNGEEIYFGNSTLIKQN